jgi:hypothetical protein
MTNARKLKDEEKYGLILYAQKFFPLPGLGKSNYPKLLKTDDNCFVLMIQFVFSVLRAR